MQDERKTLQADIHELQLEVHALQLINEQMATKADLAEFRATIATRWMLAIVFVYSVALGLLIKYI